MRCLPAISADIGLRVVVPITDDCFFALRLDNLRKAFFYHQNVFSLKDKNLQRK